MKIAAGGSAASSLLTFKENRDIGQSQMQENSETKVVTRPAWSVFAEAFAAEAGERDLQCRSFSLPKFINFLTTGCVHQSDGPPMLHDAIENSSMTEPPDI